MVWRGKLVTTTWIHGRPQISIISIILLHYYSCPPFLGLKMPLYAFLILLLLSVFYCFRVRFICGVSVSYLAWKALRGWDGWQPWEGFVSWSGGSGCLSQLFGIGHNFFMFFYP